MATRRHCRSPVESYNDRLIGHAATDNRGGERLGADLVFRANEHRAERAVSARRNTRPVPAYRQETRDRQKSKTAHRGQTGDPRIDRSLPYIFSFQFKIGY